MSDNPFYKLAPFIQEYIYKQGWTELRAVQVEACRVIFETDDHLLLATGTASGKTEAAFLPVLTLLHQNPAHTIGALYIGPLKALINDQFLRLNDLLKEADIPVWHWHGDVSRSHKTKLLDDPRGVLQITPESLESMLINRRTHLPRLFEDLRFLIIDEVHAFMGSDRGRQVLCQLHRLSRFTRRSPRRIGLSATLGDYSLAEAWLASGTDRPVVTPQVEAGHQRIRLSVEHFWLPPESSKANGLREGDHDEANAYCRYLFDCTRAREKCLVFANSRGETEAVVAAMRDMARRERLRDIYHVHHGSISAPLREAAETAMRDPDTPAICAATVTLELGIDIGQLERIVQLRSPFSVSSFVQRLGRSGRRGAPAEMWFACSETHPQAKDTLPARIPWDLLQATAIIQLYLEKRWIEPIRPPQYPVSLLYHQTMSALAEMGELSAAALAQRVLTLPVFQQVSQEDFRTLLLHLIEIDHIERMNEGGLIIGLAGEKIVKNFRFYAVFPDNEEFVVIEGSTQIGSIVMPPPPGERFGLAGFTWEVVDIDADRKVVSAKRVGGRVQASWAGGSGDIHTRVLERMRRVLLEDKEYPYIQAGARQRIKEARSLAREAGLVATHIVPLGGDTYTILPWLGSVAYRTLERVLRHRTKDRLGIRGMTGMSPYHLTFHMQAGSPTQLYAELLGAVQSLSTNEQLLTADEAPQLQKYDEYVPAPLLRMAFASEHLDIDELRAELHTWGPEGAERATQIRQGMPRPSRR